MREAVWALSAAVLLLAGLAPLVAAGHGDDQGCTTVHYVLTPESGGTVSTCPGETTVPGVPGLSDGDRPTTPATDETCPEYGTVLAIPGNEVWFCASLDTKQPSESLVNVTWLNETDDPSTDDIDAGEQGCPEDTVTGVVVDINQTRVGACIVVIYEPFEITPLQSHTVTSVTECDIPEGGLDPAIRYNEGGVAFCVVPIFDPGFEAPDLPPDPGDPPIGVDTEPCEPRATDPTIHIFDGYVQVCVDAGAGEY